MLIGILVFVFLETALILDLVSLIVLDSLVFFVDIVLPIFDIDNEANQDMRKRMIADRKAYAIILPILFIFFLIFRQINPS